MKKHIWILAVLATLIFCFISEGQDRFRDRVRPRPGPAPRPAVTTVKGAVTLNPNTGKPSGNGKIIVTLSRKQFDGPNATWVEMGTQTLPVTLGQNEKGPWTYAIHVNVPIHPTPKDRPAPAMPVAVFATYQGPWSVSTGGGPVRASSPTFNLHAGEVNVIDLVLRAELIN